MEETVEGIVFQHTLLRFPYQRPRVVSDRDSRIIPKDFKEFIRYAGLSHTFTLGDYHQNNEKIEQFFKTTKNSCIRMQSFLSVQDAQRQLDEFVRYNTIINGSTTRSAMKCHLTNWWEKT